MSLGRSGDLPSQQRREALVPALRPHTACSSVCTGGPSACTDRKAKPFRQAQHIREVCVTPRGTIQKSQKEHKKHTWSFLNALSSGTRCFQNTNMLHVSELQRTPQVSTAACPPRDSPVLAPHPEPPAEGRASRARGGVAAYEEGPVQAASAARGDAASLHNRPFHAFCLLMHFLNGC